MKNIRYLEVRMWHIIWKLRVLTGVSKEDLKIFNGFM